MNNQIVVRGAKGDKDRVTVLPTAIKPDLARHLDRGRAQHPRDLQSGAGWVELPTALARKYPNAGREWVWQWVFPATRLYRDRATGQLRRHHLHESVLQRVVKDAVSRASISKRATPHPFAIRSQHTRLTTQSPSPLARVRSPRLLTAGVRRTRRCRRTTRDGLRFTGDAACLTSSRT